MTGYFVVSRFFNDYLNVGVSTDDPILTGTTMDDEYNLLIHLGLVESHFVRGVRLGGSEDYF